MLQLCCCNSCLQTDSRSSKCIVYIKFARNIDPYRNLMLSPDIEFNSYKVRFRYITDLLRLESRILMESETGPFTWHIRCDLCGMLVIQIHQREPALLEDPCLIIQIFCKIHMLIRSDMIR